jgi:transposase
MSWWPRLVERNDALIAAVREVGNIARVAERFGISRQCARLIVARYEFETGDILPRGPRGRPRGEKKTEVKIRIEEPLRSLIEVEAKARGMAIRDVIVERLTASFIPSDAAAPVRRRA